MRFDSQRSLPCPAHHPESTDEGDDLELDLDDVVEDSEDDLAADDMIETPKRTTGPKTKMISSLTRTKSRPSDVR